MHNNSINKVFKLTASSQKGLTNVEAENRLKANGKNVIAEAKAKTGVAIFFSQFKDLMVIILLIAAAISAIMAIVENDYIEMIDSFVILLIVVVNAIIGTIQERKSSLALNELKNHSKRYIKVKRDNEIKKVLVEEVVVGDIVLLEAGDIVPADMRLISSSSLKVQETSLTGESVPVEKDCNALLKANIALGDRVNMAYSGSVVCYGRGEGIVVATAMQTELGKIANVLNTHKENQTPLQKQIAKTAKILAVAVIAIALIIFVAGIFQRDAGESLKDSVFDSFMVAIAVAVAAMPEGLTIIVTIVLAIGVKNMSERRAIVKNLPSVETLGCCEVICSDKTGTLTQNKMTVTKVYTPDLKLVDVDKANLKNSLHFLRSLALCNDCSLFNGAFLGEPTEMALAQVIKNKKIDYQEFREKLARVDELPFDSNRKLMTVVNDCGEEYMAYTKGAYDMLIQRCTKILINGKIRKINDEDLLNISNANNAMAKQALRVLAVAYKPVKKLDKNYEEDLVFAGLVGMIDPPREEVFEAIKTCKQAGMTPIMITGDHLDTAVAIAKQIGIYNRGDKAITGAQLDNMSEEQYLKVISKIKVYARVSPENKVRIVKAYKSLKKVVAMTGDGANDAPAIKVADIGVGMGITGTDVSKETADIVLADDNFATIIVAVEEGRKIYNNIKKSLQFLLSANYAEIISVLVVSVFLNQAFLTALMILWINLITDSLPALSIGLEKNNYDVMKYPPRKNNSSLFGGRTGLNIILQGSMQAGLTIVSFCIGRYYFNDVNVGISMAYLTLALIQLFHAYNCKSIDKSIVKSHPFNNKLLNFSFVLGLALCLIVFLSPLHAVFGSCALNGANVIWALILAFAIVPLVEFEKFIVRAFIKRKKSK